MAPTDKCVHVRMNTVSEIFFSGAGGGYGGVVGGRRRRRREHVRIWIWKQASNVPMI